MNAELPSAIAAFFQAHNTGQTDAFNELFTGDALVSDEQHEYRGAAIKEWIDGAIAKYQPKAAVTDCARVGDQTIATAEVRGNFPGSPTQLRYKFTLRDGKIGALTIGT
ncbi:MAG: nuclear transport factor 2 family protein [bacterium]